VLVQSLTFRQFNITIDFNSMDYIFNIVNKIVMIILLYYLLTFKHFLFITPNISKRYQLMLLKLYYTIALP